MFNWFKKEEIKEVPEEEKWIYPRKEWDSVYSKVIDINNKMRLETYQLFNFISFNDARIWWNKITERKFYNEMSHLVLLTCGTVVKEISTTLYSWRDEDGCLYSVESTSNDYDFDELENGDLIITLYRRWTTKKGTYHVESVKSRIPVGEWKKETKTDKIKIDCTIDDEHREALKKAKIMIKAYESIKKCSNPDFEGYEDKLLSNIKELSK